MKYSKSIKFGLLLIFLVLIFNLTSGQNIPQRVEPPNWWIGMNNTRLQLLIYGDDISGYSPVIDYSGVNITKTIRVSNPNYLFIYLDIDKETKPGTLKIQFIKNGMVKAIHPYELLPREAGSANRIGFNTSDG